MSTVIGNTFYDVPVEFSVSLLVASAGWIVGMNLIYALRALLGGVYKKRSRRDGFADVTLIVGIVWIMVAWGLTEWASDAVFGIWFYVELFLICLNKFVFVRMYNRKHYFLRIKDENERTEHRIMR